MATAWSIKFTHTCGMMEPPAWQERRVLRDLKAHAAVADGEPGEAA
jgi:hypothetical protein